MACSGVVWSFTIQSAPRSFGISFAGGAAAMRFVNFCPKAFAPRLNDELCKDRNGITRKHRTFQIPPPSTEGTYVKFSIRSAVRVNQKRLVFNNDARFYAWQKEQLVSLCLGAMGALNQDALFSLTPVTRFFSFQPGPLTSGSCCRISMD